MIEALDRGVDVFIPTAMTGLYRAVETVPAIRPLSHESYAQELMEYQPPHYDTC
jgi:hypothetical protein